MDLVLKNGLIVDTKNKIHEVQDIGIENGKVVKLGSLRGGKETVDLSGKTIFPGIIDTHVHMVSVIKGKMFFGYYMVAKTGVTSLVDFSGPIEDIVNNLEQEGCGLNVGCLNCILPQVEGVSPSRKRMGDFIDRSLASGALGLKLIGGHYPLTPDATRIGIEESNRRKVMIAFHAGTTAQRSDILGMKEAIELAGENRVILPHINAYCRGKHYNYLEELRDAFNMLREHPNVISESHLAFHNSTSGECKDGVPLDGVTVNCLKMFGRPATEEGLVEAIREGFMKVLTVSEKESFYLEREEGYQYWRDCGTNASVAFPANLPSVSVACAVERKTLGGDFLIPMATTDGGVIPRNDLVGRLLFLYQLGYISLEEVVLKASLNPARVFGLHNKGHLGVGADADITVIDESCTHAVRSYVRGKEIMRDGVVIGKGGCLLTTPIGEKAVKSHNLDYIIADLPGSLFYA